jgi:hypothetical protein
VNLDDLAAEHLLIPPGMAFVAADGSVTVCRGWDEDDAALRWRLLRLTVAKLKPGYYFCDDTPTYVKDTP